MSPLRCCHIVTAGNLGVNTQILAGSDDHLQLLIQIVILLGHQECEIQIAHIMVNSATTRKTAGEVPAVLV